MMTIIGLVRAPTWAFVGLVFLAIIGIVYGRRR